MAVTTLGNVVVGNPITLTNNAKYIISGTNSYLSGVTVNSISDVDFTITNAVDVLGVDFSHNHNDIYWTQSQIASAYVELDSILPTAELGDNILDARYYTETELNISGGGGAVHYDNITNIPTSTTTVNVIASGSVYQSRGTSTGVTSKLISSGNGLSTGIYMINASVTDTPNVSPAQYITAIVYVTYDSFNSISEATAVTLTNATMGITATGGVMGVNVTLTSLDAARTTSYSILQLN